MQHAGKLFQLERDPAAEEQAITTLGEFGLQRLDRFICSRTHNPFS